MADVNELFGGGGAPPTSEDRRHSHEISVEQSQDKPKLPAGRPEWLDEAFWGAREGDPTTGEVKSQLMATALKDTKAKLTTTEQSLADLRKSTGADDKAGKSLDDYLTGFDFNSLAKLADRSPLTGKDDPRARAFFDAARRNGLGVERARTLFSQYLQDLNPSLPERLSEEAQRVRAVEGLGPNGPQQLNEVKQFVGKLYGGEIPDTEAEFLKTAIGTTGGLAMLWRLSRGTGSQPPPTMDNAVASDRMSPEELREAFASKRFQDDSRFRERMIEAGRRTFGGTEGVGATSHVSRLI